MRDQPPLPEGLDKWEGQPGTFVDGGGVRRACIVVRPDGQELLSIRYWRGAQEVNGAFIPANEFVPDFTGAHEGY